MDSKWDIAFSNMTITEYADMTYKEYYASPANTLEAQLKAAETAERRFGVGRFITPHIDTSPGTLSSLLGMRIVFPQEDEIPSIDVTHPVITDVADVNKIRIGNPKTDGSMAKHWQAWQYYKARGYPVALGGHDGSIVTTACEVSGNSVLIGLLENPEAARQMFDVVVQANRVAEELDVSVPGKTSQSGYIGDDFAGLLSPEVFRTFVIPCYEKIFARKTSRFLHSELLRCEHLRIARDILAITDFHGAGAENLTLSEMHEVMGHDFWAQLTPHELFVSTPAQIRDRIKVLAGSAAGTVQLYPGRGTPDENMRAAIATLQQECTGGPRW